MDQGGRKEALGTVGDLALHPPDDGHLPQLVVIPYALRAVRILKTAVPHLRCMNAKDKVRLSKFLSLVLRHDPGAIGIELDANGWTSVDELITKAGAKGQHFDMEELRAIVSESDKQRFAISADGTRIRANQGHSVEVQLGYEPSEPPTQLFHGTAAHNLEVILVKGARHHVHLSADKATALKVGQRQGKPAILRVDSGSMHRSGIVFYRSENGVWLTDHVPPAFLQMEAQ